MWVSLNILAKVEGPDAPEETHLVAVQTSWQE